MIRKVSVRVDWDDHSLNLKAVEDQAMEGLAELIVLVNVFFNLFLLYHEHFKRIRDVLEAKHLV